MRKTYSKYETILLFTDDEKIITSTEKVANQLKLKVYIGECIIDLYAVPTFFQIIDPDKLDKEFINDQKDLRYLENPKEFCMFLTKHIKLPRELKRLSVYAQDNGNLEAHLRTEIINRQYNIKKRKNDKKSLTRKLSRLFSILRRIEPEGNYVRISDLAKEFAVSEKTILRDLQFLRDEGGEEIKYDPQKKGYYLDNSFLSNIGTREYK